MDFFKRTARWFLSERSSTRLSFLLQIICRIGLSLLSFLWTPLLLASMGRPLNGLFLNFQKITSLGGLGDLGLGGIVNIQTSRLLGQGKETELRSFLAAVRGIFSLMSLVGVTVFLIVSPTLFRALNFHSNAQVGSLSMLSLVGALAIGLVILNSYITNLNYGCGTVTWPVIPTFIVLQLAACSHWLLARQHEPLWVQFLPYLVGATLIQGMNWFFLRISHPSLAVITSLRFSRGQFFELTGKSFWFYVAALGNGIYMATDLSLISAHFGPDIIPTYTYNNRLCELAIFVVGSASIASMPKITQWLASPEPATRQRGIHELIRLNKFQTLLGCCAILVYLPVNDWFMGLWLGENFHAPFIWQAAFAANMGAIAAGMMGTELAVRCCENGIRVTGMVLFASALLNFGLSFAAMKLDSIFGIALATVIAQSILTLYLGWFATRELKISWWRLSAKNWLLAMATLGFAFLNGKYISAKSGPGLLFLVAVNVVAFVVLARAIGITWKDLQHEKTIFLAMFGKQKKSAP